jgi:folate-binding protein YgfZ
VKKDPVPAAPAGNNALGAASSPDDHHGYHAARRDLAALDRSGRTRLSVRGRAPDQVLAGLLSGKLPPPLTATSSGGWMGRAEGSALLTAKGRMVAELRVLRGGPTPDDGYLLDVPAECREEALAHLRKFVPPRLANVQDVSQATAMFTVLGPRAPAWLGRRLPQWSPDLGQLAAAREGDLVQGRGPDGYVTVVRSGEVGVAACDVIAPATWVRSLWPSLLADGGQPLGPAAWEILRVEAGRPRFGAELDDSTIPVEAGIHTRVVDYQKGCFTGQEVLVRIRDRGHVNRVLRGLRLGQAPLPAPGTPLFREGEARPAGTVTSAVRSPHFGEAIGLGYVRREVEPPALLRLGSSTGPSVRILDLESGWSP